MDILTPQTLIITFSALLLVSIAAMAIMLRHSLKKTLYSYTNIGLIGGILFALVIENAIIAFIILSKDFDSITYEYMYNALIGFPREFSYYAVFVMMAVCVLLGISNIALIRHEGFCLNNALSLIVAGFYIGGTWLVYFLDDLLKQNVLIPKGIIDEPVYLCISTVIPTFLLLMISYFECILAGTTIMGYVTSKIKPHHDRDFMIILGCSIDKRGGLLPLLKGRVNRAIRFAWEQEIESGKPMKYIPSGGKGANEVISEGSAMELYLLSHGAEDYEVMPEKASTNTYENMKFSKVIGDKAKPDAKYAFATTNYHILRSGIIARRLGLDAEGVAGDTKWYFWPNGFIREFFAILKMNMKAHIFVAVISAILCIAMGIGGYMAGLF